MKRLLILFGLLFCSAIAWADDTLLGILLKARYAMAVGDYDRALALAEEACAGHPASSDASILQIEVMLDYLKNRSAPSSDFEAQLLEYLQLGLDKFPKDYRFYMYMGRVLSANQRWRRFTEYQDPEVYLNEALLLMDRLSEKPMGELVDTNYQLGLWYFAKEETFLAAKALRTVCDLDPTMSWAFYYAGQACERNGQFNSALAYFEKYQALGLREFDSARLPLRLSTAILRALLHPEKDELRMLFAAIEDEGVDEKLLFDVALRFYRMDNLEAATKILQALRRTDGFGPEALNLYLRVLMERHRYGEVIATAETEMKDQTSAMMQRVLVDYAAEAALLAHRHRDLNNLARNYGQISQLQFRLTLFRAFDEVTASGNTKIWDQFLASDLNPEFTAFLSKETEEKGVEVVVTENFCQFYQARRDWKGAIDFLESRIESGHPDFHLWDDLADGYALAKMPEKAFGWYRKILEQEPDRADILNNYGYFMSNEGRGLNRARTMIAQANELAPNTPAYLDSLGWVHYQMGNLMEAERFLLQALNIEPEDPEKLDHFGDVQWALGNKMRARQAWSHALGLLQEQAYFLDNDRILGIVNKLDPPDEVKIQGHP